MNTEGGDNEVTPPLAQEQTAPPTEPPPAPHPVTIEGPTTGTGVAVRRTALPKQLEAMGVVAAVDAESGMQILVIPPSLRAKANVLMPVQAFQQADPNWTPSLRVVELDPSKDGPHFYSQQGKLAPRKQALELLADAAGVVQITTSLVGRERVEVGGMIAETFTHVAVLRIRKSDGTLRTMQASRTYEPFAEYEELKGSAKGDADLRKKWVNEIRFAKAKNESKAINRAMRAALQIAHSFTAGDAAKPFVVVGWNLAPQDTTAVQAAIASLYGASPAALELPAARAKNWDEPEDVAGELVPEDDPALVPDGAGSSQQAPVEAVAPPADTGAPGAQDASGEGAVSEPQQEGPRSPTAADGGSDEQAPGMAAPVPEPTQDASATAALGAGEQQPGQDAEPLAPAASPEPSPVDGTTDAVREPLVEAGERGQGHDGAAAAGPAPPSEPVIPGVAAATADGLTEVETDALPAALAMKIPSGSYQARSLGWVLELGEPADEWLAYALKQPWPHDTEFKAALMLAVKAHRPEMFSAWSAGA